jgi:hypothetical protein
LRFKSHDVVQIAREVKERDDEKDVVDVHTVFFRE